MPRMAYTYKQNRRFIRDLGYQNRAESVQHARTFAILFPSQNLHSGKQHSWKEDSQMYKVFASLRSQKKKGERTPEVDFCR